MEGLLGGKLILDALAKCAPGGTVLLECTGTTRAATALAARANVAPVAAETTASGGDGAAADGDESGGGGGGAGGAAVGVRRAAARGAAAREWR